MKVEPGSKGSVTARLRQSSREGTSRKVFGLKVGRMAMARTSPVRGSSTTAIAALALRAPIGGVDLPLGQVLDRAVDRQHHAVARRGRLQHALR